MQTCSRAGLSSCGGTQYFCTSSTQHVTAFLKNSFPSHPSLCNIVRKLQVMSHVFLLSFFVIWCCWSAGVTDCYHGEQVSLIVSMGNGLLLLS